MCSIHETWYLSVTTQQEKKERESMLDQKRLREREREERYFCSEALPLLCSALLCERERDPMSKMLELTLIDVLP